MNKFLIIIRWILLPIVAIIGTIAAFLLGGIIISYLTHLLRDGTGEPVWWTNIVVTAFQGALMGFLAFWIAFKIAPRYKVKIGISFVILFSLFGILLPLFTLCNFIFDFYPVASKLENFVDNISFNFILNIISQLAQIGGFVTGSYYVYNEEKYNDE